MSIRQVFEYLEKVELTSGRNTKLALIDELISQPSVDMHSNWNLLRDVIEYTYSPFKTYRVVVGKSSGIYTSMPGNPDDYWRDFKTILDDLNSRSCELAEGKIRLQSALSCADLLFQKFFTRITNHDLKIGLQTFTRWFPKLLPNEPVMLCETWDGEDLGDGWIAEPKLDGYRAAVVVDNNGDCTAISRGNKEFWNWEFIEAEIKRLGIRNVTLDGEFYAGNFGATSSICKTQSTHPDRLKLKYWIFDALAPDEWKSLNCTRSLEQRKIDLVLEFQKDWDKTNSSLVIVPFVTVSSAEECQEVADQMYQQGFEGTVLKKLSSVYVWDRTRDWLKLKPEETADLAIQDAKVGEGRHSNRLGAILVEGEVTFKKKHYSVMAWVGGGYSDPERDEIWILHQQGKLVGKVIQVRYQDVTTTIMIAIKGIAKPSLRFPRFERFRLDKTPAEFGGV